MQPVERPAWRWIAAEAGILWLAALVAAIAGVVPALGLRVGMAAVLAGLAWAALLVLERRPSPAWAHLGVTAPHLALLAAAVLAAFALRWVAAGGWDVPLGYDYGFYKVAFDSYEGGVPRDAPAWLDAQFEPGLPALHAVLHGVAGLSSLAHLTWFWTLLASLLPLAAFVAARAWGGTAAGLVAAGLTAVSFTQAEAHAYLYEKNLLGLLLFVVALYLLGRRSWVASGALLAGVAILTRPTALLAAIALPLAAVPTLRRHWRGWALAAGVGMALALPVWLAWSSTFLSTGVAIAQASSEALATGTPSGTGTFFTPETYLRVAAAYLPLAIAALAFAWRDTEARLPAVAAVVAGLYVALALPLHLRFLLMLDAVALVLAGPALVRLLPRPSWVAVAGVLLVVAAALPTVGEALEPSTPHVFVTSGQFDAIGELGSWLPANATILADNLRAPYVIADSGRRTSGPGLFDDPHNRTEWQRFASGLHGSDLAAFLEPYGPVVFVAQVDEPGPDWGGPTLREPEFRLAREDRGLRVWEWTGDTA